MKALSGLIAISFVLSLTGCGGSTNRVPGLSGAPDWTPIAGNYTYILRAPGGTDNLGSGNLDFHGSTVTGTVTVNGETDTLNLNVDGYGNYYGTANRPEGIGQYIVNGGFSEDSTGHLNGGTMTLDGNRYAIAGVQGGTSN